jgi:3-oxoacyl-[acyl-carrier-protein] synthase-3
MAGLQAKDIDAIIFATLSPDYNFPGSVVPPDRTPRHPGHARPRHPQPVQRLRLRHADRRRLDPRGVYKNVLFVGAEVHSTGLDVSTRPRRLVIFGDGAGAVISWDRATTTAGVLTTLVGADGALRQGADGWSCRPRARCRASPRR